MNKRLLRQVMKDKDYNIKYVDMSHTGYIGNNYYANKELKDGWKLKENDIIIEKTLSKKRKRDTIRHELVERHLMKRGMKYDKADKIANKYG